MDLLEAKDQNYQACLISSVVNQQVNQFLWQKIHVKERLSRISSLYHKAWGIQVSRAILNLLI
jgi:hypothetical protein